MSEDSTIPPFVVEFRPWRVWVSTALLAPLVIAMMLVGLGIVFFAADIIETDTQLSDRLEMAIGAVLLVTVSTLLIWASMTIAIQTIAREPVLVIDDEGIRGRGFFKRKHFRWDEIESVKQYRSTISIVRASRRSPWLLGFDKDAIVVETILANQNAKKIYNAVECWRPGI